MPVADSINEPDVSYRVDIPEVAEECHVQPTTPATQKVAPKKGFGDAGRHLVSTLQRVCARKRKQLSWSDAVEVGLGFVVAAVLLIFPVLKYTGSLKVNYRWGFHCGDPALMEERPADGDTISTRALLFGSILLPALVIVGNELAIRKVTRGVLRFTCGTVKAAVTPVAIFVLAVWYTFLITDVLKSLMAMPRPHFFQTCQPSYDEDLCALKMRITDYTCTSKYTEAEQFDSQQSFPSGHASISASAATVLIIYTFGKILPIWARRHAEPRMDESGFGGADKLPCWRKMVPNILIAGSVVWAAICGMSRVRDNRHHWWDVLAGTVLGVVVASLTIYAAPCQCFVRKQRKYGSSADDLERKGNSKNKKLEQQQSVTSVPDTVRSRMTPRGSEDHATPDSGHESAMVHDDARQGASSARAAIGYSAPWMIHAASDASLENLPDLPKDHPMGEDEVNAVERNAA